MYLHGKYLTASALARTQPNYECVALSPNQRSVIDIDSEALGVQYTEPRLTERVAKIEREPFSFNASSDETYIKEAVGFLNDFVWSSDRPGNFPRSFRTPHLETCIYYLFRDVSPDSQLNRSL